MAILINDNYSLQACKPFDARYLNICAPWTSVSAVNLAIPTYRYTGLTVNVMGTEYWYKDGIADSCLVVKSLGGTLTSAINGLHLTSGGTTVVLGGALTGNTFISDVLGKGIQYSADYSGSFVNNSLVSKLYVDSVATGLRPKAAVRVATTGSVVLSGLTTIDGVPVQDGDRVLIKNQGPGVGTAVANGVYVVASGSTWTRAVDFDGTPIGEVVSGSYMWVLTGSTNGGTAWVLVTPDPIIVNSTPMTFALFAAVSDVIAGTGITVNMIGGVHVVSLDVPTQAVVNSALTGATNGLSISGRNVVLGGTLTGDTTINTICHSLSLCALSGATNSHIKLNYNCVELYSAGSPPSTLTLKPNCLDVSVFGDYCMFGSNGSLSVNNELSLSFNKGKITDNTNTSGLTYAQNYGGTFVNRSLVDKEYVDMKTSGATGTITGATNGLTVTGKKIKLGGTLTGTTDISGAQDFLFGGITPLTSFGVIAMTDFELTIPNNKATISLDSTGKAALIGGHYSEIVTSANTASVRVSGSSASILGTVKLLTTPSAGSTSDTMLVWNSSDKQVKCVSIATITGATSVSANNGLHKSGSIISLGGTLTGNTSISLGSNSIWLTGNSSTCLTLGAAGRYIMSCPVTNLVLLGDCTFADNYIRTSPSCTTINAGATGVLKLCSTSGSFFLGCATPAIYCGASNAGIKYSAVTCGWITSEPKALVTNEWTTGYTQAAISCKSNTVNVYNQPIKANYTANTTSDYIGAISGSCIWMPPTPKACQRISIADISGHALDCMITIIGNGKCINGADCATVNTDYGSVTLINNGTFWSAIAFIN
jgi:hypothetical protein